LAPHLSDRRHRPRRQVDRTPRIGSPEDDLAGGTTGLSKLPAPEMTGRRDCRCADPTEPSAASCGAVLVDRLAYDAFQVDVRRWRSVPFESEVELSQAEGGVTVSDRVVKLGEHGTLATLESVDDHEEPQRAGAIEGVLHEAGGEVVQLAQRARGGQRDMP
jgi:hypothetical protein